MIKKLFLTAALLSPAHDWTKWRTAASPGVLGSLGVSAQNDAALKMLCSMGHYFRKVVQQGASHCRRWGGTAGGQMMRKAIYFTAALAPIIISSNHALSADLCKAVALRDVAAVEDPESVLARGSYDDAVTQYRVNKQTGMTTFCSHGGYCYPSHVQVNGQKVEALQLINCKIGERNYEDKEEVFYSVDVVRSKNSPAELRHDDLDNKFLEMGLCSACAGNVTMFYVNKPTSLCARLAKQALEGNAVAADKLRDFPDYCKWGW
jgi:hypothetical protein